MTNPIHSDEEVVSFMDGMMTSLNDQHLNEAVARKLGYSWNDKHDPLCFWDTPEKKCTVSREPPDFCHSIEAAWEIVEKVKTNLCDPVLKVNSNGWLFFFNVAGNQVIGEADTAPMAIVKAFLKLP